MITAPEFKKSENRILLYSFLLAAFAEFFVLTILSWQHHWLAHPEKSEWSSPEYIQTEIFTQPEYDHLVDEKPEQKKVVRAEKAISVKPDQGKKESADTTPTDENQTDSGPKTVPTHGPIVISNPTPVLPDYLRQADLKTKVVIDFFISSLGVVTPRLVGSSGNEELDALALSTAKQWKFHPAEVDHKAIDSKIRLRINFQVQ